MLFDVASVESVLRAQFASARTRSQSAPRPTPPPMPDAYAIMAEPAPCDACDRAARCATNQEACSAFVLYVRGATADRWRLAPRLDASVATFDRLFAERVEA